MTKSDNWQYEYARRIIEARSKVKPVDGKIRLNIQVYDLLEKSKLSKTNFYKWLFEINSNIDSRIVLYLKF